MNLKELHERKAALYAEMREMNDRLQADNDGTQWTPEQEEAWKRCNAEYDANQRMIEAQERIETVEARQTQVFESAADLARRAGDSSLSSPDAVRDRVRDEQLSRGAMLGHALRGWIARGRNKDVTELQAESAQRLGINLDSREMDLNLASMGPMGALQRVFRALHPTLIEQRLLDTGTPNAGGETIPEGFVFSLEEALLAWGGMRQASMVMRTASGNLLPYPTADDTAGGGGYTTEGTPLQVGPDPTFDQIPYSAHKCESGIVKVTAELLLDSAFDMAATIGGMLGTRLGRNSNAAFTNGSGTGEPTGLLHPTLGTVLGKAAGSATDIDGDDLIDLNHSVDPAYRIGARWMMHDSTVAAVRKIKETTGQYLWQPGLQMGVPDMLLGYPITVNQDFPVIAASANVITFGDHTKYIIREVNQVRIYRLVELYRESLDADGFLALIRNDGRLLKASANDASCPVKHLSMSL